MVYMATFEEILSIWQAKPMKSKKPISVVSESSRKLSQDGVFILKTTLQIGIVMCLILVCFTFSYFNDSEFIPFLVRYQQNVTVHLGTHWKQTNIISSEVREQARNKVDCHLQLFSRHTGECRGLRVQGAKSKSEIGTTASTLRIESLAGHSVLNITVEENMEGVESGKKQPISEPKVVTSLSHDWDHVKSLRTKREGSTNENSSLCAGSWGIAVMGEGPNNDAFRCDHHDKRSDVCFLRGDVLLRTGSVSELVLRVSSSETSNCHHVEIIRPYSRKWEPTTMASIEPVTLRIDGTPNGTHELSCDLHHSVPAVFFSTGGFTGNPYHDFQDVLIPLFITSQHRKGEVIFVVSDIRKWWIERWNNVLQQLSNYPIIDTKEDMRHHCFPEVTVGLHVHKEFGVDSARMPNGESMKEFQHVLHKALGIPRMEAVSGVELLRARTNSTLLSSMLKDQDNSTRKLKLLIVARTGSRVLVNQKQITKLAKSLGFETKVLRPTDRVEVPVIYSEFHNSHVVMGVHGAALAHMVFMKRRAVLIQIVPLGTDWPSDHYYERPAKELDLQYIEYKIQPNESSLSKKYGSDHPIVRNPDRFTSEGWATMKQIYLSDQNVRVSLKRFRKTLLEAKQKASVSP
ncbi:protein MpGT61.5 [Marchantia polymorpha subsp. ruderalis]|uniref:Glycosyltransferase 61 catalytic domain-containing protein n=2 Tax=Marchantia polymorpha TaxID=3197 RepID=A0AAF6B0S6_MARPO|nr:hypothetical protein MARPO_0004s0216 [Marchantia polymorpha]BBN05610.1 hypothetical protein Mp_3g14550 [Marchantia polymorpha subsp. ruderalis]|eukprot:PTQ48971.1 hypothetical protein MARPO_0004s0216 [Marchantia polymorpha]